MATLFTDDPGCRQPTGDGCPKAALAPDAAQVVMTYFGFTPTTSDTTVEAGFLVLDRALAWALARALASHCHRLIDISLVVPLLPVG